MSSWFRRERPVTATALTRQTVGNAVVVHPADGITPASQALAMSMVRDDEHDLVVLDLPAEPSMAVWEAVATLLPRRRQGVRLVFGGRSRETIALAGQWLTGQLGRPVVVPDGALVSGVGGSLLVDSGRGSGWLRCQPGKASVVVGKRHPRPRWDISTVPEAFSTSARFVTEPIHGGLWVRPIGQGAEQQYWRAWLTQMVPCQRDVLTVVLGTPRCPVTVDDAATVWMRMPEELRSCLRFVDFGPTVPGERAIGQALADLLGTPVACYTGMPVGTAAPPVVCALGPDGQVRWQVYARELLYEPGTPTIRSTPLLLSHRRPLPDSTEVEPAVYRYAPDAVIEVIQSGLWLRPPQAPPYADTVRATRPRSSVNQVVFDESDAGGAARRRRLAEDIKELLDPHTGRQTEVVAVSAFLVTPQPDAAVAAVRDLPALADDTTTEAVRGRQAVKTRNGPDGGNTELPLRTVAVTLPRPEARPVGPARPGPRQVDAARQGVASPLERITPEAAGVPALEIVQPTTRLEGVRRQRRPDPEVAALPDNGDLTDERAWLRADLGARYDAMAASMSRILADNSGFEGIPPKLDRDAVADAVAVRRYLSWEGDGIDHALRMGSAGPHVPFARCVAAGLRRLPAHRGPVVFSVSPTAEELRQLRPHGVLTEWGFLNALTAPCAATGGAFDVLLWSITGRRTASSEPETSRTDNRVVFLPGSRFTALIIIEPSGGARGQIFLRELASSEIDGDDGAPAGLTQMDELAVTSLHRQVGIWAAQRPRRRIATADVGRFAALPGLVTVA